MKFWRLRNLEVIGGTVLRMRPANFRSGVAVCGDTADFASQKQGASPSMESVLASNLNAFDEVGPRARRLDAAEPANPGGRDDRTSVGGHSYGQMLRSWSIMGGSAGLNYLISLLRIKIVAVLLGPSGLGLIGLYTSATDLFGTVSNSIGWSAVREVARAVSQEDARAVARTVRILRRVCWATGIFGWLAAVLLAKPISIWLFDSTEHVVAISILGVTLVLNALSTGRLALLQGLRRIEDVAWTNVIGTLLSTIVATGLYAWLGEDGILPVLIATASISLGLSYWFSSRVRVVSAELSWTDTFQGTRHLLVLGVAFMWTAVLGAGLDTFTRSIVATGFGIHAAGIYQAAWALSGTFAGVVLAAMGADFYPRLSAVVHDKALASRLVNQQLELGILIVLPGLLGTLSFAPLIMKVLYTKQFLAGAELLRWMMLGVFSKTLCWPMSTLLLAKGASRLVVANQTAFAVVQVVLLLWLEHEQRLVGVAQASAVALALQVLVLLWIGRTFIGFTWSSSVRQLVVISSVFITAAFAFPLFMKDSTALVVGGLVTLIGCMVSVRGLAERLGSEKPLNKWISVSVARIIGARDKSKRAGL